MSARGGPPAAPALPAWAVVNDRRRDHIARVTALLDDWARAMRLGDDEAREWHDAGLWHDALRDAPEPVLRTLAEDDEAPAEMLHGPAAARRLEADGERRPGLLDAVRWHTVGNPRWARTGRALYMADYLEPGRNFAREDRAFLARLVPVDFDGAFRQVVRARLEWTLREGRRVYPGTVELWNDVH